MPPNIFRRQSTPIPTIPTITSIWRSNWREVAMGRPRPGNFARLCFLTPTMAKPSPCSIPFLLTPVPRRSEELSLPATGDRWNASGRTTTRVHSASLPSRSGPSPSSDWPKPMPTPMRNSTATVGINCSPRAFSRKRNANSARRLRSIHRFPKPTPDWPACWKPMATGREFAPRHGRKPKRHCACASFPSRF